MTATIFFSVGEPSGDQHAARLIEHLAPTLAAAAARRTTAKSPIRVRGFGGRAMAEAGCELDLKLTDHAVVGIAEVIPKYRQFKGFVRRAEAIFAAGGIDAVVLVDFPGFNWHIAAAAKKHGIPVIYYCPPQLWAWGRWRVKKMKRLVDHVLSVLPMETELFRARGIETTEVGHPFYDAIAEKKLNAQTLRRLRRESARNPSKLIAILPGSRRNEVHRNFPVQLAAARRLHDRLGPGSVRFAVAAYSDEHCLWCRRHLQAADAGAGEGDLPIEFYTDRTSEVIDAAEAAMMVSGSVSLELMARRTPAVVMYRTSRLTHLIGKTLLGVGSITLPNLIAGRVVFPERVSSGRDPGAVDFLVDSLEPLMCDEFYRHQTHRTLERLAAQHAVAGASGKAAAWIRNSISEPSLLSMTPAAGRRTARVTAA